MLGFGSTPQPRGDQQHPDADRDEMEHADHVVGGGVVRLLLVAAVETLELGHDRPARKRAEEHEDLVEGSERPGLAPQERRQDVGEAEPNRSATREAPRDQPARGAPDDHA